MGAHVSACQLFTFTESEFSQEPEVPPMRRRPASRTLRSSAPHSLSKKRSSVLPGGTEATYKPVCVNVPCRSGNMLEKTVIRLRGYRRETAAGISLPGRPLGVYSGEWGMDCGQPDGDGEYKPKESDRHPIYRGQWRNGFAHEEGRLVFPDGTVYRGQFNKDIPDGKGTLEVEFFLRIWNENDFPDESFYEGAFRRGVFHGDGLEVQFLENPKHVFNSDIAQKVFYLNSYAGNYSMGRRQGKGEASFLKLTLKKKETVMNDIRGGEEGGRKERKKEGEGLDILICYEEEEEEDKVPSQEIIQQKLLKILEKLQKRKKKADLKQYFFESEPLTSYHGSWLQGKMCGHGILKNYLCAQKDSANCSAHNTCYTEYTGFFKDNHRYGKGVTLLRRKEDDSVLSSISGHYGGDGEMEGEARGEGSLHLTLNTGGTEELKCVKRFEMRGEWRDGELQGKPEFNVVSSS